MLSIPVEPIKALSSLLHPLAFLWLGPSECQNSLFSITIKKIRGREVKERKWLQAGKGHGQKDYFKKPANAQ